MGMYDTVDFFCPKCDEKIKKQSKAGSCELKTYRQDLVPVNIAMDLRDLTIICPVCDTEYIISGTIPRISLYLFPNK